MPLLTGQAKNWRESVLIEFYTYENPMPWLVDMDYRAVRTHRYKYVHWTRHEAELYDLVADPLDLELGRNLAFDGGAGLLPGRGDAAGPDSVGDGQSANRPGT